MTLGILLPLSNGGYAIVDQDAPPFVFQMKWCWVAYGALRYARGRFSKKLGGHGRVVFLHRLIMGEPAAQIDHVHGDGLDCRRTELQVTTQSRNLMKGRIALRGGASFDRQEGRWRGRHRVDGHLVDLGFFDSKEQALAAVRVSRERAWAMSPVICPEFSEQEPDK